MGPKDRLIFPLDVPTRKEAQRLIELLKNEVGLFKVGLELFVAAGPEFLPALVEAAGIGFFLDLKFHDIPATVRGALRRASLSGAKFVTVHCDQGRQLLETVVKSTHGPQVLAVTVLTSLDSQDLESLGFAPEFARHPSRLVLLRARLAKEAGCAGVVCSGWEAGAVKAALGPDFIVVTPGIRPAWSVVTDDDQKRIMTPSEAIRAGADYIVVGRPIRTAADPVAAARRVVAEIAQALEMYDSLNSKS